MKVKTTAMILVLAILFGCGISRIESTSNLKPHAEWCPVGQIWVEHAYGKRRDGCYDAESSLQQVWEMNGDDSY